MKRMLVPLLVIWACPLAPASAQTPPGPPPTAASKPAPETLPRDTPRTTAGGATFTAPKDWSIAVDGAVVVLLAPDGDTRVAIVESSATDPDAAVAAAWAAVRPGVTRSLRLTTPGPGRDGWDEQRFYSYETSPNERRAVGATALKRGTSWTVWLVDGAQATMDQRGAQVGLARQSLRPKGYTEESFAGKKAHPLDSAARQAAHRVRRDRDEGAVDPRSGPRDHRQRPGRVLRRPRRARARQAREGGRRHDLHDRVEHQAADDPAHGRPGRRRQARLGYTGDEGLSGVQARRRRHHATSAGQASPLRVHRSAAAGLRMALGVPERHAGLGDADARRHAADDEVRRALPVQQPDGIGCGLRRRTRGEPRQGARRGLRRGHAGARVRAARDEDRPPSTSPRPSAATTRGRTASTPTAQPWSRAWTSTARSSRRGPPARPGRAPATCSKYVQLELSRGKLPDGSVLVSEKNLLARRAKQVAVGETGAYGMGLSINTNMERDRS